MPEDKGLIRKRVSYKGKVTVFFNYLNSLKTEVSHSEVNVLQQRINRLESLYVQYNEVQLASECSNDNLDGQLLEGTEFESLYYKTLSEAQKVLDNYKKRDSINNDVSSRSN